MSKKFNSQIYTQGKFGKHIRETLDTNNEFLYSYGIYKTKIKSEDLPKDYIKIHSRSIWYMYGYLKTSGIIDIKYKWRKINHLFKDDYIYISYNNIITKKETYWGYDYENYDISICGNSIIPILLAAEKNSNFNIDEIKEQIEQKRIWYKKHCTDDYEQQFGKDDVDLFEYWKKYI